MDIHRFRDRIDRLDARIVKLLNERMEQAVMLARAKEQIIDPAREAAVIDQVCRAAAPFMDAGFIEELYRRIIAESRRIQSSAHTLIGFQGEHGAYSEEAADAWDPTLVAVPCREFAEVFDGIAAGTFDLGIVPVENSLGGMVVPVNELLIRTNLHIVGAVELPVSHCLLALPESDHRDIRAVYSHPQALAQCRGFIARNRFEAIPFYDTAGAARMLAEERPRAAAAIAGKLCADRYGLEILKEQIEDSATNRTRFLLIGREPAKEPGNKCSLTFSTEHRAGTLFSVLELFARADINLTRIESLPVGNGVYQFLVDLIGSADEPRIAAALKQAVAATTGLRLLGCYRELQPLRPS